MLNREHSPVTQSDIPWVESEFNPRIDTFRWNGFLANSNKSDTAIDICSAVLQVYKEGYFFLPPIRKQAAMQVN